MYQGRKRVLIIGDSLAVPRPRRGQHLEDTWPVLLKHRFPELDIWQRCRAASMSIDVCKEFHQFSDSVDAFSAIIVQVGIGDCCPRPYPHWLHQLFLTYGSPELIRRIGAHYGWMLKLRSRPWVSPDVFRANFVSMVEATLNLNPKCEFFILAIGTPCNRLLEKAPGIANTQPIYNHILSELCDEYQNLGAVHYVDPYRMQNPSDIFLDDGHHLTNAGHRLVFDSVAASLAIASDKWSEEANVQISKVVSSAEQLDTENLEPQGPRA